MSFSYFNSCVGWPDQDVHAEGGLVDMIDRAIEITRRTFLKNVGLETTREFEQSLGYDAHPKKGLTMAADWCVSYYRSKLHGETVYYVKHSAIEHVFADQKSLSKLV